MKNRNIRNDLVSKHNFEVKRAIDLLKEDMSLPTPAADFSGGLSKQASRNFELPEIRKRGVNGERSISRRHDAISSVQAVTSPSNTGNTPNTKNRSISLNTSYRWNSDILSRALK